MATIPPTITEQESRDLGFGSVISKQRNLRLLNRDGSFNVGRKTGPLQAIFTYHGLLALSWWKFIGLLLAAYFALNALFAVLYVLCGAGALMNTVDNTVNGRFAQAFFFSVETFSTVGYGNIVPRGLLANLVMTLESVTGLLGFALGTGLLFARFSRPTAEVVFSKVAVLAPYRGITAFEFRIVNRRANQLIEVAAKVLFSRFEEDGGSRMRRYYPLALERPQVVFFPLSWTVVHPINSESPLFGLGPEDLARDEAEFLILLTGIDETFAQTVHARSSYRYSEIVWGAKFAGALEFDDDGSAISVNMERFHEVEPDNPEGVLLLPKH